MASFQAVEVEAHHTAFEVVGDTVVGIPVVVDSLMVPFLLLQNTYNMRKTHDLF